MRRLGYLAVMCLLMAGSGCARPFEAGRTRAKQPGMCHLASSAQVVCKHCNCLMPADLNPAADCPACNCHRQVHQCHRGY